MKKRMLNIPVELLLRFCKDRRQLELLAFRIYIMSVYKNATIFDLSTDRVKRLMRCDSVTAQRLIDDAMKSEWFSYSSRRNSLRALTMKSQIEKLAKNNMSYRSDFCFAWSRRFISLNELVKRLRGIIVVMTIIQFMGKKFHLGATEEMSLYYIMVYQKNFTEKLGLSQGAVSKLLSYLVKIHWIEKTDQTWQVVKSLRNSSEEQRAEYKKLNHNCKLSPVSTSRYNCRWKSVTFNYIRFNGIGYRPAQWFDGLFTHIIWTHNKRKSA